MKSSCIIAGKTLWFQKKFFNLLFHQNYELWILLFLHISLYLVKDFPDLKKQTKKLFRDNKNKLNRKVKKTATIISIDIWTQNIRLE